MAHLVHRMMGHVAVERPVAWSIRDKINRTGAADLDKYGGFDLLGRLGDLATVGSGNLEIYAVKVHRMVVHGAEV